MKFAVNSTFSVQVGHLCPLPCSSSCLSVKDVACPDILMKHWNSRTEIILTLNIIIKVIEYIIVYNNIIIKVIV